jgi:hypothetical protein
MSASSPGGRHSEPPALPGLELRAPTALLTPLLRALAAEGLDPLTTPLPAGQPFGRPHGLVLLAHTGAPAPDLADGLVLGSRPHLLVGLAVGHVDLGPFVDPGLTACLRCLYAAAAPPVLATPLPGGAPSDSLLSVAAAFLAHDVRRWAGGHEPATWSATVRIDTALGVTRRAWPRHPQCGCTWSLPA